MLDWTEELLIDAKEELNQLALHEGDKNYEGDSYQYFLNSLENTFRKDTNFHIEEMETILHLLNSGETLSQSYFNIINCLEDYSFDIFEAQVEDDQTLDDEERAMLKKLVKKQLRMDIGYYIGENHIRGEEGQFIVDNLDSIIDNLLNRVSMLCDDWSIRVRDSIEEVKQNGKF